MPRRGRLPTSVTSPGLWKWLGLAGLAGVAATGAVVARQERVRRAYTADDVRARLHEKAGSVNRGGAPRG